MIDRRTTLAAMAALLTPAVLRAQAGSGAFPTRPVRLVVPYAAGGITDSVARWVGQKLQDRWGQPVVVENKPGASGAIGAEFTAKSPPDGYTLMMSITSMLQAPLLDAQLRFDLERDFAPVAQLGTSSLILVASSGMGVQNLAQLRDALRASPKRYSYGSIGTGSSLFLYADQLTRRWGVQPTHVPFKGASPLVLELISDRVDFAFLDFMTVRQHVESGKLKAIAVTGPRRSALFPAVPTLEEGGVAGFEVLSWVAAFAPKGTPPAIVSRISADLGYAMKQPDIISRFAEAGMEAGATSPEEFGRRIVADRQAWSRLITESKASPQQ